MEEIAEITEAAQLLSVDIKDLQHGGTGGKKAPILLTALNRLDGAIDAGGQPGIDHAFVINRPENSSGDGILREAAKLIHHTTGREMKISTT